MATDSQHAEIKKLENQLGAITLQELQSKDFPEVYWCIDGFLPRGYTRVAADYKIGKTDLMLQMSVAVAQGLQFWGMETHKSSVLYYALDDEPDDLLERIENLCPDGLPENFFIMQANEYLEPQFQSGQLDDNHTFENILGKFLDIHPDVKLIIIDTLQMILPITEGSQYSMSREYEQSKRLRSFAEQRNICIVATVHNRKMRDSSDVFNQASGTVGGSAGATNLIALTKVNRNDADTTLTIVGRRIKDAQFKIYRDGRRWVRGDDVSLNPKLTEVENFRQNPITQTLLRLTNDTGNFLGNCTDILDFMKVSYPSTTATTRSIGRFLNFNKEPLKQIGISYEKHGQKMYNIWRTSA